MAKTVDPEAHVKFELSEHLPYLFKHIHSQLEVASSGKLAQYGVNVALWRILAVLWEHGDLSNRELAHRTSIEVSTLSRISKSVQRDGLIRRKRTMQDQRTVRVTLTEKGKALAQEIIPSALAWQKELVGDMTPQEIGTLTGFLHRIVENLNAYSETDAGLFETVPPASAPARAPRKAPAKPVARKPAAKTRAAKAKG